MGEMLLAVCFGGIPMLTAIGILFIINMEAKQNTNTPKRKMFHEHKNDLGVENGR